MSMRHPTMFLRLRQEGLIHPKASVGSELAPWGSSADINRMDGRTNGTVIRKRTK